MQNRNTQIYLVAKQFAAFKLLSCVAISCSTILMVRHCDVCHFQSICFSIYTVNHFNRSTLYNIGLPTHTLQQFTSHYGLR